MSQKALQIKTLSSLAKVFPEKIVGASHKSCRAFRGQEVSFQVAYRLTMPMRSLAEFNVSVDSSLGDAVRVYQVGIVPSMFPVYPAAADDGYYITRKPGLFPDPLIPMKSEKIKAIHNTWSALWISVKVDGTVAAGSYPIRVSFANAEGEVVAKATYEIVVEAYTLPAQKLLFTQWFHCDCIADAHHVPVFSEAHWTLIEKYMKLAGEYGMNMILTPVVTPPLDTAVGGERPTVQLVAVEQTAEGDYRYDCALLSRYIRMALNAGITNFEISHFFTQWGAKFTPKVVAKVKGRTRRIFGWDTNADDPAYVKFLGGLVPEVIACFAREGVSKDRLWFHVSDEPHQDHLEQYKKTQSILEPLIEGCHHIDALSSYDFYQEKLVEHPVVATDHIKAYLEHDVPELWCYYCCGQGNKLSNRFMAMPSARTRIMGVQLYKFNIMGFLQWGYNFYYSQFSLGKIDPYANTDAGCSYPSGDAFSVYPDGDGVAPSLRQKVFSNGLEDLRLLNLLEEKIGRTAVLELLERVAGMEITFEDYPHDDVFFTNLYDAVLCELNK